MGTGRHVSFRSSGTSHTLSSFSKYGMYTHLRALIYTEILEVNVFASVCADCFMKISFQFTKLERNLHETMCRQMQIN